MPHQNDTGGARQFSRLYPQVQVCCLPLLRALWLNRLRIGWSVACGYRAVQLQETT